jgi:ribose-phosphate pyrophosphokinase
MELIGDVKGKNVILVDDMIDTGGLAKAADLMMEKDSARAICTHAILSGEVLTK